jgi:hypothetical protein
MKKIITFIIAISILSSCIEQVEIEETTFEDLLVIESIITTENKKQTVRISKTSPLNSGSFLPEKNAMVTVSNNNSTIYTFTEVSDGVYESNQIFSAKPNIEYTLEITSSKGEKYQSTPQHITGINDIDNLSIELSKDDNNQEGVFITVNSSGIDKDAKYYRYTYEETQKIIAPHWSSENLKIISNVNPFKVVKEFHNENRKVCYKTNHSKDIMLFETATLDKNDVQYPIRFINKNDKLIARRYSIEVTQYIQSFEAYTYYNTLKKTSSSSNVFSQNQPGFIQGNIFSTSNASNKVIGFFEVNSISKKRLFFNHEEVFPNNIPDHLNGCNLLAPLLTERDDRLVFSPLIEHLETGTFLLFGDNLDPTETLPGPYLITPKECGDCRELGSNIKPTFWID